MTAMTATTTADRTPSAAPTPIGASTRTWDYEGDGCRRCGPTTRPEMARGLCVRCWTQLRAVGGLWRFPALARWQEPGNPGVRITPGRLSHRQAKQRRDNLIHERAFLPGRWTEGYWSADDDDQAA
jgi:hypothetical protein